MDDSVPFQTAPACAAGGVGVGHWHLLFPYLSIIALVMPGTVLACATEINKRPATTFFMGLLTKMILPLIVFILAATGIGAIIVPFLGAALAFGALIGKTALFEALGFSVGRRFGTAVLQNALIAFLLGIGIITILYMVPVIGFLALGVVSRFGDWAGQSRQPLAP